MSARRRGAGRPKRRYTRVSSGRPPTGERIEVAARKGTRDVLSARADPALRPRGARRRRGADLGAARRPAAPAGGRDQTRAGRDEPARRREAALTDLGIVTSAKTSLEAAVAAKEADDHRARERAARAQAEVAALRAELALAERSHAEAAALRAELERAARVQDSVTALRAELARAEADRETERADLAARLDEAERRRASLEALVPPVPDRPDDLKEIVGIGPKAEEVLHRLGVTTFRELAALTGEHRERAGTELGDPVPDLWIEQARALHVRRYAQLVV